MYKKVRPFINKIKKTDIILMKKANNINKIKWRIKIYNKISNITRSFNKISKIKCSNRIYNKISNIKWNNRIYNKISNITRSFNNLITL